MKTFDYTGKHLAMLPTSVGMWGEELVLNIYPDSIPQIRYSTKDGVIRLLCENADIDKAAEEMIGKLIDRGIVEAYYFDEDGVH